MNLLISKVTIVRKGDRYIPSHWDSIPLMSAASSGVLRNFSLILAALE